MPSTAYAGSTTSRHTSTSPEPCSQTGSPGWSTTGSSSAGPIRSAPACMSMSSPMPGAIFGRRCMRSLSGATATATGTAAPTSTPPAAPRWTRWVAAPNAVSPPAPKTSSPNHCGGEARPEATPWRARCGGRIGCSSPSRCEGIEMARLVGINHVALEVGDVDEALAWYGRFFEFELRGRAGARMAFIDMGDQFIALSGGRTQPPDRARHFGLVVDDKEAVRAELLRNGVTVQSSGSVDLHDPWGNHVQVVDYREVQFSKTPAVLRGMDIGSLEKTDQSLDELRRKGLTG